jgi:hypothetical protein
MLDIYTVSFFGHRQLDNFRAEESRLEELVRNLLMQREYIEFLVGQNGEFDQMAASTVLRLKRVLRNDNSSLILVLPYATVNNQDTLEGYYDEIEVCEAAASAHFKSALQIRNRAMVDRSNLVVCCVERQTGGAYQTVRYAAKQGKRIINVADTDEP